MRITPTARACTTVSGYTGSCPSTSTSSGSPSRRHSSTDNENGKASTHDRRARSWVLRCWRGGCPDVGDGEIHHARRVVERHRPRAGQRLDVLDKRIRIDAVLVKDRENAGSAARGYEHEARDRIELQRVNARTDWSCGDNPAVQTIDHRQQAAPAADEHPHVRAI